MKRPAISCGKNGPLVVKGLENLIGARGERLETKPAIGLCRCGASANKPFCDGSHKEIGFTDEKSPQRTPDKLQDYPGREITIHNNVLLCSHSEYCVRELPGVFSESRNPWIDTDGDTPARIRALIQKCPSGALSYSINGVHQPDNECAPAITIEKNGPYRITGSIELKDAEWGAGASREHYTLCRCGVSRNKPFCDGSHAGLNFDEVS